MFARYQEKGLLILLGALAGLVLAGCGASSEPGAAPSAEGLSAAPSLRIVSPKAGDSVQTPVQIEYIIAGLDPAMVQQYRLRVTIDSPPLNTADLPLSDFHGTVLLADDKVTPGRRDLTFTLVRLDGAALANPAATVIIRGVTIAGRR
jgi:hypothetical protein